MLGATVTPVLMWAHFHCSTAGQSHSPLAFFHVPPIDAAHDFRFRFVDFRSAVVSNPVPIRDRTVGNALLFGSPRAFPSSCAPGCCPTPYWR